MLIRELKYLQALLSLKGSDMLLRVMMSEGKYMWKMVHKDLQSQSWDIFRSLLGKAKQAFDVDCDSSKCCSVVYAFPLTTFDNCRVRSCVILTLER